MNNGFKYTYSAKEQEEVKKIRDKYTDSREEDKMARLRRLDESVTAKSTLISLIVGIIGALILGVGMCCVLVWGINNTPVFVLGIIVGIIGIAPIAAAYPIYLTVTQKEREKVTPEILKLTDELLK